MIEFGNLNYQYQFHTNIFFFPFPNIQNIVVYIFFSFSQTTHLSNYNFQNGSQVSETYTIGCEKRKHCKLAGVRVLVLKCPDIIQRKYSLITHTKCSFIPLPSEVYVGNGRFSICFIFIYFFRRCSNDKV